jgi:hypothetical protein
MWTNLPESQQIRFSSAGCRRNTGGVEQHHTGATDGSGSGTDLLVVPWAPGPLIRLERGRARDDLDELLDDLFGPDDDGGPGWFDVALLAGGVACVAAAIGGVIGSGFLWLGIPSLALGSVLPARSVWRAGQRRRAGRARQQKLGRGLPIDASDTDVDVLIRAYEALVVAAAARPAAAPLDESAVAAAHTALLEAASLLRGAPPVGPAEREYVRRRAQAIDELVNLLRGRNAAVAAEEAQGADAAKELDRAARFEALTELDDRLGPDSIEQMAYLRSAIEGDKHR